MKFLNICLIVCTALIANSKCHDFEGVRIIAQECKDEVGATDDDVETMFKHDPAGSTEAKCLHACVMKRFGLMNDDGKMDKEKATDILKVIADGNEEQESLGLEVLETCVDIDVNEDHCEAAEDYRACMHAKATENGFTMSRV
nr:odorant binding protein 13 [Neoceratitis asiatica]